MNIQQMMRQAQAMQQKIEELKQRIDKEEFEGNSGAGMVKITINGKGDIVRMDLDKEVVNPEETDILADLITAAFNDARKKMEDYSNSEMSGVTSKLGLPPGIKLPF